jgi:hypothetical protein
MYGPASLPCRSRGTLTRACGTSTPTAQAPTPQPIVITQIVTRIVERTVVVTATPKPATPTPKATATPQATPTATPDPAVTTKAIGGTLILSSPADDYKELAEVAEGEVVTVLHKVPDWLKVQTAAGVEGWSPRVRYDISDEQLARVEMYPDALLVFVGDIVQELIADSTVFKGKIENRGGADACMVEVEIETFDAGDNRMDLVQGYINETIPPGESRSFQTITSMDFETFVPSVSWSKRCS